MKKSKVSAHKSGGRWAMVFVLGIALTWVSLSASNADRNGGLTIRGAADLKMTDFGVEPPRLMLGTLRVGDDINVQFVWAPNQ